MDLKLGGIIVPQGCYQFPHLCKSIFFDKREVQFMTSRENILLGLRRREPERVGFDFTLSPALHEEFKRRTGREDYAEYHRFPVRGVDINATRLKTDFSVYYETLPSGTRPLDWNPEWGVMGAPGATAHFQEMLHPMGNFTSVEQLAQYPWPDFLADYRWEGVAERARALKERDLVCAAFMEMTIFEIAWYLRGMDSFMEDLVCGEDLAMALIDRLTEIRVGMARRYAGAGADILMLGDDVATQVDMMISPELWRDTLKPPLGRVIRAAREAKPDILIFYHGDGNMERILPELIEIGVDVLNPVQPECMEPVKMKERYGDSLAFWGCIGTQTTMPFANPKEVQQKVRDLIEAVGKGGGLFLSPTHVLEPDVPWENVEAFIEAVHEQ
jgi:uroporphyrinogen decarboxylase